MPQTIPHPRLVPMATGDLSDADHAVEVLDRELPPSALPSPRVIVLDLRGKLLSPVSLRRLVLTLGQRVSGGVYGETKLVVLTSHQDITDTISELAVAHDLPVYVSQSMDDPMSVRSDAQPVGGLSETERETLGALHQIGGSVTISGLAGALGIGVTAANNRLVNVEQKNYVFRVKRGRRVGDLFVDPRVRFDTLFPADRLDAPPRRNALLKAGITTDPYDVGTAIAEGEAADRAAEILRRHGHIK